MNRAWILFHLQEGVEELERTIREISDDPEYGEPEFAAAMRHLYHHINTAWNARAASEERTNASSDSDFDQWERFPADLSFDSQ
jgi:hypothetical protein